MFKLPPESSEEYLDSRVRPPEGDIGILAGTWCVITLIVFVLTLKAAVETSPNGPILAGALLWLLSGILPSPVKMFPLGIIVNVIWATCLGWLNQDRIEEAVWWDNLKNLERSHEEAMKAQEEVFKKELEEFDSRLGIQKKISPREKAMLQHWSVYIQKNETST